MNRDDIILNDFISVLSVDDSWTVDSLELSTWYYGPKGPNDSEDEKAFWSRQLVCAKTMLEGYKTGKLDHAGYVIFRKTGSKGVIEFALRAKDLPDDIWNVIADKLPEDPCVYSECLPAANLQMFSYRDVYGCIGRSWETNLCTFLAAEVVLKIREIKDSFGAYAAALSVLKVYGSPRVEETIQGIPGLMERINALFPKD